MVEVTMTDRPYRMKLSLSVLDDLGVNLYSNVAAVLSEAVANAWDADAELVEVTLGADAVEVLDDGIGMDIDDVNERFLTVGYRRRDEGRVLTDKGRHVMGRKGIGKLSLFAIADEVVVDTRKVRGERHAFAMRTADIREAIERDDDYHPEPLDLEEAGIDDLPAERGTRIVLRDLKKAADGRTEGALRRRLARRFSILGARNDFEVQVNGDPVTAAERGYWNWVQYLWVVGEPPDYLSDVIDDEATQTMTLAGDVDDDRDWAVSGWIGTVREHRRLDEEQNSLPILAHGKLVQEDILGRIKQGGLFTKYIVGELTADFVDFDELDDIATSDRQHLKEDDERYRALLTLAEDSVRQVGNDWLRLRRERALDDARSYEAIDRWYETLGADARKAAGRLFERVGSLPMESEDDRKELYKHGILAFERLRQKDLLSEVDALDANELGRLLPVFAQLDDIEAAVYADIARSRLNVIRKLEGLVDDDAKERVIQEHLFDHLWLLSASWERATSNPMMEKRVEKALGKVTAKLGEEEAKKRLDITFRTGAGKQVIIELKRYSAPFKTNDLLGQMKDYRNAARKVLEAHQPHEAINVEVVAVVGKKPADEEWEEVERQLAAFNGRIVTYDELISGALAEYEEYLEASRNVSEIGEILEALDSETLGEHV